MKEQKQRGFIDLSGLDLVFRLAAVGLVAILCWLLYGGYHFVKYLVGAFA